MKKIYTRLCTLALAMCVSAASWAVDVVDGVYQIGSTEDLFEFADAVLDNNGEVDAVLTADIDLTDYPEFTISSANVSYKGTFDGQFHTITVALAHNNSEYHSLFRKLGAGTIKNMTLAGTMHAINKHCAPLVGQAAGAGVIENVASNVDIETTTDGDGSHGGLIGSVTSSSTVVINNVVVGGKLHGPSVQCGGVIGWADGKPALNNVLVIAEFEIGGSNNAQWGNLTFVRNPGNATLKNCYYLNALDVVDGGAIQITQDQLASGEVCFMLNGSTSENPQWFQTISVDAAPVPNPAHGTVYLNGRVHCNAVPYEDGVFSNTKADAVQDEHNYVDGVCDYCNAVDPNYVTADEEGFYSLATAEELRWFAYRVNGGETGINGRLTAAIDLADVDFPTIGNKGKKYTGSFDGQLMPITNINVPFFGQTDGATITGIALESGDIFGRNQNICDQSGTIICRGDNSTLTRSYSKVNITLGDEGDCGGLTGKFNGTIKNCYYAGTCTSSGWSHAGIAGSNEGTLEISDCFVIADLVSTGGEAKGTIIGWEGGSTTINNCVSVECEGFAIGGGHKEGVENNCIAMTIKEFENGAAAWFLNGGTMIDPTWYQTLDEDGTPVLDPTHGIVFQITDEEYTNDMATFVKGLVSEGKTYAQNVVAYKNDIEAYDAALDAFAASDEWDPALYEKVAEALRAVKNSADAYSKLMTRGQEVANFIVEHADEMFGAAAEALSDYIEVSEEPSEAYPNGTYVYIVENMQLTAEEVLAEIEFLNALQEAAVKANYKKGDEITNLIVNADLSASPRWTGWEAVKDGSTLTTGTVEDVMTVGEYWNATGYVKQTITGLKNGVYEVRANAATRPASNDFNANDNYIAYIFANDDEVYVQALTEDMVDDESAVDGVNCHLTGDAVDHQLEIDGVTYYVPYGPVSGAYAFNAGRYENRVLTNVTDGTLTLGIRLPGSGLENDWIGFASFRLFYLGATDEAADAMDEGIANYVARANTLINYEGVSDYDFTYPINCKSKPNFSQALRDELKANIEASEAASTTEEKIAVCARFTELFHEIDACKAAYIELLEFANIVSDAVFRDADSTPDEMAEMTDVVVEITGKWEAGAYTTEQAVEMAELKATAFYQRYFQSAPALKGGYYQLATASDMVWFSNAANSVDNKINGEMVAAIDLTDSDFTTIGSSTVPYAGKFKGNLYPITGLDCMLFGVVENVTIDGVCIQGGVVEGNAEVAPHTGALAGLAKSGTFTRCYSSATVQNGAGDCGGFFGKVVQPVVIKDFMFAGNLTSGWSAGLILGSGDGNDTNVKISDVFIDARNVTYKNGDGHGLLGGWFHDGLQNNLSNVWVIEGPELTNIVGYNNDVDACYAKSHYVTAEQAASGEVTYGLNNGVTENPVWYQTIGEDLLPTFSSDSKVVIVVDGTYMNFGDDPDAIETIETENAQPKTVNVYDLGGRLILNGVDSKTGLRSLPNGLYIIGGRKVVK